MYSFLITNDWDWVYNREWVYNGGLPDKVPVACPHWLSKRPCQLYNKINKKWRHIVAAVADKCPV